MRKIEKVTINRNSNVLLKSGGSGSSDIAITWVETYRTINYIEKDVISLYDDEGNHLGNLVFTDQEEPGENNDYGYKSLVYPRNIYLHCIDTLRNEAPVKFENFHSYSNIRTTVDEPVGEGE